MAAQSCDDRLRSAKWVRTTVKLAYPLFGRADQFAARSARRQMYVVRLDGHFVEVPRLHSGPPMPPHKTRGSALIFNGVPEYRGIGMAHFVDKNVALERLGAVHVWRSWPGRGVCR
jgi:hypothetical protein